MDGLQAVPDIRQRPSHDHAHCVIEIRRAHLVFNGNRGQAFVNRHSSSPYTSHKNCGSCRRTARTCSLRQGQASRCAPPGRPFGATRKRPERGVPLTRPWRSAPSAIVHCPRACRSGAGGSPHSWPCYSSRYTSRFFTSSACCWMKLRRGSTSSPISVEKIVSTPARSSSLTFSNRRVSGFIVFSHSFIGFISTWPS